MPPYHALITGQVTVLCNISYFLARGYTLTLTHIHLGEAGYPKLTMDIFRCAFLKDQEQMMNCRSCLCSCMCLQGISWNPSRAKHTPHLSTTSAPSALQIPLCTASILPKLFTILKTPRQGLKLLSQTWGGVGCLPSPPACKLSPVKVTEPASEG